MHKNVILTSAGRRGLLVQQFQQELGSLFPKSSLFAVDLLPEASSACLLADRSGMPVSCSQFQITKDWKF